MNSKVNNSFIQNYFDNLPKDCQNKCFEYVMFKQSPLLLYEIKIVSINYMLNAIIYSSSDLELANIYYIMLKKYYEKSIYSIIDFENEYDSFLTYINSFNSRDDRKIEWIKLINELSLSSKSLLEIIEYLYTL